MSSSLILPARLIPTVEPCVPHVPQLSPDGAENWDAQGALAQVQGLKHAR